MRLALFGGTFDPIHRGHLAIASAAADTFQLDQVLFAPTGRQPLKSAAPAASFHQRLAMANLACQDPAPFPHDPRFQVSDLDAPRPDGSPNYTVDLLHRLTLENPAAELYVLAGADSFLTLRRWKEPATLLRLARWIVVSRPGSPLTQEQLGRLSLTTEERAQVHLLTTLHEDVSGTELRRQLVNADHCSLVPTSVLNYIREHGLYLASKEPAAPHST